MLSMHKLKITESFSLFLNLIHKIQKPKQCHSGPLLPTLLSKPTKDEQGACCHGSPDQTVQQQKKKKKKNQVSGSYLA